MVSIHRQFRLIYLIIREDWPVLRDYRARDHHQFLYCGQSRNFFVAGVRFCGLLVPYITDRQTVNNNKRVGTMANWGFDSAATVDSSTMSCLANAGAPTDEIKFILRYLDYESGVHNNLTASEASYIHSLGIAIGLIYGSIPHESLTFDDGVSVANTATSLAENLGIPTYVGIYADLGTSYDDSITADFLMGYAWQLTVNTPYHPGFYGSVGTDSAFDDAFSTAYNNSTYGSYIAGSLLWSSEPETTGCTDIAGAPAYNPNTPPGTNYGLPVIWQYAEGCGCSIDEDESSLATDSDRWWLA